MHPDGADLRRRLKLLVNGMTSLRHDGRFTEPNLDGTAGDYISFDAW
jgi:unsaturated rhamnogalacturonyl hydrolase